jgi:hypothetical protein
MTNVEILYFVQEAYNTITGPYNTDAKASELRRLCYFMSRTDNYNTVNLILCYIGNLICTDSDVYRLLNRGYSENGISVGNFKFSRNIYSILHNKSGISSNIVRYNIFVSTLDLKKSWNVSAVLFSNKFLFMTPKGNILLIKKEFFNSAPKLYKRICKNDNN